MGEALSFVIALIGVAVVWTIVTKIVSVYYDAKLKAAVKAMVELFTLSDEYANRATNEHDPEYKRLLLKRSQALLRAGENCQILLTIKDLDGIMKMYAKAMKKDRSYDE